MTKLIFAAFLLTLIGSIHANIQSSYLKVEVKPELTFECTIPDHGGGCWPESMYLTGLENMQEGIILKVSNISYEFNNEQIIDDLSTSEKVELDLIHDRERLASGLKPHTVYMHNGNNIIRITAYNRQNEIFSMDYNVYVHLRMGF